jgi:PIN domain nuclease of toxin-antitoxin system
VSERLFVTDTHPLIYFFCDGGKRLSKKAKHTFEDAVANQPTIIFVPAPVLWELSLLVEASRVILARPFTEWVDELFAYPMINSIPFDHETVEIFHQVRYHSDPFDRAIVATAKQLELPLISNDGTMHKAKPCKLLWD